MLKKILSILLTLLVLTMLTSCRADFAIPLNVSFKDQTLYGSRNYVLTAVYQEDKRLHEKYTDILIKSNRDNSPIKIGRELDRKFDITLEKAHRWYSLTNLLSQNTALSVPTFARVQTTTFIINSDYNMVLTFKAIGGDYSYIAERNEFNLVNEFDVSKEFEMIIKNHL